MPGVKPVSRENGRARPDKTRWPRHNQNGRGRPAFARARHQRNRFFENPHQTTLLRDWLDSAVKRPARAIWD